MSEIVSEGIFRNSDQKEFDLHKNFGLLRTDTTNLRHDFSKKWTIFDETLCVNFFHD